MASHGQSRPLGDFELVVLLAAIRCWDEAYGTAILREIEARTGRVVSGGALYVTLDRLEAKGYIRSTLKEPSATRGARPRRYITVTSKGLRAVRESRAALLNLMRGLDGVLGPVSSQ
jgi:DNA-binding PadR family transcriptional regulator